MTERAPQLQDFVAIANEMLARAPTPAEVKSRNADSDAFTREENLHASDINGVITPEDWRWLVEDSLPEMTHALDSVQRWFNVRSTGRRAWTMMALLGETGRGKTLAGAWLLARLGGKYVWAEELCRLMTSNYPRQQQEFREYVRTRVLVVDDAGGELDAHKAKGMLLEVVNHRQGLSRGWTVIAANLSPEDFCERYGERTVRRLQHQGAIVQVEGPDMRRRAPLEEG